MARPSNKDQRRQDIATAFLAVMSESGYAGATIRAIAKQAGISPGLIHHHFANKQDILLAAVNQLVMQGRERYESLSTSCSSPREQLQAFIDARLGLGDGHDKDAVKAWILIGSEAVRQTEVRHVYQQAIADQQKHLAELIAKSDQHQQPDASYQSQAALILSAIEGAYLLGSTCSDSLPQNFAAQELTKWLPK